MFGNSIAIAHFKQLAQQLVFESGLRAEHFPAQPREIVLEPYAARFPFNYPAQDAMDLGHSHAIAEVHR